MKKKFINAVKILLSVTLVGSMFVGCSGKSDKDKVSSDGKTVIRYATGDSGPAVEIQQKIVDEFNKSQDKIEVQLEIYGTAFDQKLAAAIGAGNAPDVVKMWNFPAYYKSLVPMNDYIDKLEDKDDFFATLFNYANMNDQIYGMPIGFSTRALQYNKKLVEEAGITINDDITLAEMAEYSKQLTHDDKYGFLFYYNPDPYAFESFLWSNGGSWLDNDGNPVINSKENKEVIQLFKDMAFKDKSMFLDKYGNDFGQALSSGKYAMGEMGKWFIPTLREQGFDLGVAPLPAYQKGKNMSVVHASFLSITNSSKNPDAAWEFIKYYTSPESVKTLLEIEMPVRQSVADEVGYTNDQDMKYFYDMLEKSVSEKPSLVKSEKWPEISAEIATGLEAIFTQESSDVSKILDEVQNKVEQIVK